MATTRAKNLSYHDRRLARRLRDDPEFRAEFDRQRREITIIDSIVGQLDALREQHEWSKAQLAREIGKNASVIRRMLTAPANPELRTVVAMADALDADVCIVPRTRKQAQRSKRGLATAA